MISPPLMGGIDTAIIPNPSTGHPARSQHKWFVPWLWRLDHHNALDDWWDGPAYRASTGLGEHRCCPSPSVASSASIFFAWDSGLGWHPSKASQISKPIFIAPGDSSRDHGISVWVLAYGPIRTQASWADPSKTLQVEALAPTTWRAATSAPKVRRDQQQRHRDPSTGLCAAHQQRNAAGDSPPLKHFTREIDRLWILLSCHTVPTTQTRSTKVPSGDGGEWKWANRGSRH